MHVEATTASPLATDADTIAVGCFEHEELLEDPSEGALARLLSSGEAGGERGRVAVTHGLDRRFILVGLGPRATFDSESARVAAAAVHGRALELRTATLCWRLPDQGSDQIGAAVVEGTLLSGYRFLRYKPQESSWRIERLLISAPRDCSDAVRASTVVVRAQNRARDLVNTPANDLSPAALATYSQELAERHGFHATVLDEREIRELGMGAFAAVAQGSEREARLIRLEYDGSGEAEQPRLALVGKAVTFDSGGLSLKSAGTMHEMKFDMGGGAAVIESIAALAELGAPVRVLGVVGATENLPSGRATRPGDIVRALDGTTIEIKNTDAEGRLVLADCLVYARREGCEAIVDIATLTGGVVIALGSTYAGLMSNDRSFGEYVAACGTGSGELVWPLPLHPEYEAMIKGRHAQLNNMTERREATPITAAELLHHFAGELRWAHVDIAGVAWDVRRPYFDGGATGFGVRLLVQAALGSAEVLRAPAHGARRTTHS